jgi:methylated-DNA-protein-cysteine methyltransferase-like protein
MSKFTQRVIDVVSKIPRGRVVSYGQVAMYVGVPRAARQVGWILNRMTDVSMPWWRVINNKGRISIKGSQYSADEQRRLLLKEGIDVKDDLTLDMEKYRFRPDGEFINKLQLDSGYLNTILKKIPLMYN